jgi:hypothetical protein
MYVTEEQAKEIVCHRTMGTKYEKKCLATGCMAFEPIDTVYQRCEQCGHQPKHVLTEFTVYQCKGMRR